MMIMLVLVVVVILVVVVVVLLGMVMMMTMLMTMMMTMISSRSSSRSRNKIAGTTDHQHRHRVHFSAMLTLPALQQQSSHVISQQEKTRRLTQNAG